MYTSPSVLQFRPNGYYRFVQEDPVGPPRAWWLWSFTTTTTTSLTNFNSLGVMRPELDFTHFKRHIARESAIRWYRVAGSFCTSELAVDSEKPSDTNHQWLRTKVMSSITFPGFCVKFEQRTAAKSSQVTIYNGSYEFPESMLLLYSERPTQANPNRKRLPATVIAEQDRRFLLVRERGPAPQPAGWGD